MCDSLHLPLRFTPVFNYPHANFVIVTHLLFDVKLHMKFLFTVVLIMEGESDFLLAWPVHLYRASPAEGHLALAHASNLAYASGYSFGFMPVLVSSPPTIKMSCVSFCSIRT